MNKRLLSKITERKARAQDVALANKTEKQYLISCEEIEVEEKKMLLMYFYKQPNLMQGNTQAELRLFLSKDSYITQMLGDTRKWRTGSLSNIIRGWHWSCWYEDCVLVNDTSLNALSKYLGANEDPLEEVDNYQKNILATKLSAKHDKLKRRIDKQMEKIKALPKDFENWIDQTALFHSRYIYYTYKARKVLDGYCTHCKSDVEIEGPLHNEVGTCPNCKSHIQYKSMGNSRNVTDKGQAALIQKFGSGIVVRYFNVSKSYAQDYKNPKSYYQELTRDIYDEKGQLKSYEWLSFKQTGKMRWCDGNDTFGFYNAVLYEKNLDRVLECTIWQYSAIKQFATHEQGFGFPVYQYLKKYKEYPVLEYLVKLGLYNLTKDTVCSWYRKQGINLNGNTSEEVLGIDKKQLEVARRINAGTNELNIIKEIDQLNLKLTDEQIVFISNHLKIEHIVEMSKYTTVHQIIKYISAQSTKARNIKDTFTDWRDYVSNCKMLEYDLRNDFILFPRNLEEEHDRLYKYVQKNEKGIFNKVVKSMASELQKSFNWQYGSYVILVPKTADEVTKEGQVLRHCVGSYLKDVAKGNKIILFLRKKEKPEEPFYTMQVNPNTHKVEQCRGKKNKSMDKRIEKIVDKFKKEKLELLS